MSSIKIVKKNERTPSLWSGGKTTQLAIFPKDADYSVRNFNWRISTAIVEVEDSLFTHLPGINRVIMILDGEMYLDHEGHHSVFLKPFEQDRFDGGWTTRSKGKVTDFNLMLAKGYDGELIAIHLEKDNPDVSLALNGQAEVFYCVAGFVRVVTSDEEIFILEKGDTMILNSKIKNITLQNDEDINASVIRASIY
ncbi:HutD family protein [Neobacillus niacini]|uniref:HutD/Ves family protein n=1 Tax=Neobacillus niacini TaxID=86668 RepID=UPI00285528A1|nr:HutD family protein [Neobacillus niacini]MDR6997853.1 environmental stress-induced protein Ves [Neobacillus niacini]